MLKDQVFNESLDTAKKSYADAKLQVMLLNDQVKEAAGNKQKEKKAVDDYNDSIGKTLGRLNTFKEVQDSLITQGDKYVDFIFKLNMANAASGSIEIYIASCTSSLLNFNEALYDLDIISGSGDCPVVTRILEGKVKLSKEVTVIN